MLYFEQVKQRLEVSELHGPVQSGLERSIGLGNLRSIAEQEFHGFRLTFPARIVQRRHVLLVLRINVATLSTSTKL